MKITRHTELIVDQRVFDAAMAVFAATQTFPKEETYSLTDQIRRSSRSVSANTTEAWRKRRYEAALVGKLNDAETEAAETQTWLQFAVDCEYLDRSEAAKLCQEYDEIIAMHIAMICEPKKWVLT